MRGGAGVDALKYRYSEKKKKGGTSLEVQQLRLHTSTAGGACSIPGGGTKIPACHVVRLKIIYLYVYIDTEILSKHHTH